MQHHLSGVNLGYHLPDGSLLFNSLTFSFGAIRTGLVGANGIGKTTLLELLVGNLKPARGNLVQSGRISYLPQMARFEAGATVAQALALSDLLEAYYRAINGEGTLEDFEVIADRWDWPEQINQKFKQLGVGHIALTRKVSSLSGGELMRIRIAGMLLDSPDFLILDEPTNHLDLLARDYVYELVASWKKGMVVVSHDRRLLSLLDQTAELSSKGINLYGGNYEFYKEQRTVEQAAAEQAFSSARQRLKQVCAVAQRARERQQKRQSAGNRISFKKGLPSIVAGGLQRSAENSAARLKGRHEQKIELAQCEVVEARSHLAIENHITVNLASSSVPAQKRMLELIEVNYCYSESGHQLWASPLSFEIVGPERIWLKGENGTGKSTLIDLICGKKLPTSGNIQLGSMRIGLLDQQVSVLDDSKTVLGNLKQVAPQLPESELRNLLGRFQFIRDDALKLASVLSGGERMRAGLACLLCADQAPKILVLDEPTNNLDLPSVEALVSSLSLYRGVLIAVSHDETFLRDIGVTRVIELLASNKAA